ncbi:MAG: ABC transporter permease [Candidatus Omnitrophica bacterium]|nr:ABC transporter permease [Candidatus Omnitrophota bacterium]
MGKLPDRIIAIFAEIGQAVYFLGEVLACVTRGRIRWTQVLRQIYEQGAQSLVIVALTALASGMVLALQGYVALARFGAKEYVSSLVALSLTRELGPVFTALIFSGKAGGRIAAELGTMSVNDQILGTRAMGVDPVEFLIVPRLLACCAVVPLLTVIAELVGISGGYLIGVTQAHIPAGFYISQTIKSVTYVDFFSGLIKVVFFGLIIGWTCCYQGYRTSGGSLGVGRYTTQAVAYSYIFVILANAGLTKLILSVWG